eukprot:TRINITY_DN33359_c0_g1_i1.p1 TRINITY_DN33359_c0_g1~~TRINITY_DN33359_c0_g1_i1.p1  ORF type:complete len:310 (-),score=30.05 TRINITY_DN33359_c0_g1_i1:140-1069(-)
MASTDSQKRARMNPSEDQPRYGIIGGSGVQVQGRDPRKVTTPFGDCLLTTLDDKNRIVFANRHLCTTIDSATGKATYAPPHEVNYKALIWALVVDSKCRGIVAMGSTGTLHPDEIPVGSVVMADDYYMVRPEPITFWGNAQVGAFDPPEGGVGRIHYTPANPADEKWTAWLKRIQTALSPVYPSVKDKVALARGQTAESWPFVGGPSPGQGMEDSVVYVNTIGPRFETRSEIRAYRQVGHIVGMTCGREWTLCEELNVPYCVVCFCDNACNGLSKHPQGAAQEYLDHKAAISDVTGAVVRQLVAALLQE